MAQFFMPTHPEFDVYIHYDVCNNCHDVTIKWKRGLTLISKRFPVEQRQEFARNRYVMACWISEQFDAYNSWR